MELKKLRKQHFIYVCNQLLDKRHYIKESIKFLLYKNTIILNGFPISTNFGDALNIPLVEILSKKKVIAHKYLTLVNINQTSHNHYTVIGSILQRAKSGSIVWGAGFITDKHGVKSIPNAIYAVRGPLSREVFKKSGIECPEVYGDPALLLPYIYYPQQYERSKIGIIPHYVDKTNQWVLKKGKEQDVKVIDIEIGYEWKKFINEILQCKVVITSSLHAIIVANAYNIPSVWVSFSASVTGGSFKFRDYYLSVGKSISAPVVINENTDFSELFEKLDYEQNKIDLVALVRSCPFATAEVKDVLISIISQSSTIKEAKTREEEWQ